MRRPSSTAPLLAAPVLLAPAALTFSKGGYFDGPRLWAGVAAWALVAVVALRVPDPLPRSLPGRLILGGIAGLTLLTGLSLLWTPLGGQAGDDLSRLLLYLAFALAAIPLLRPAAARAAVEPVLLATTVAAALYGLSERLLPDLVRLERIVSAGDRLAQPITYWNATGAVAAFGLALAAGRVARGGRGAMAAAACAPPLGLALYLTFSRGAFGAAVVGLAVLVAVAPTAAHARAVLLTAVAAAVPAAATAALPGVEDVDGAAGDGAAMLAILVLTAAAAAPAARAARRPATRSRPLRAAALVAVLAATAATFGSAALSFGQSGTAAATREGAGRLATAQSNRDEYWRVALGTFADHPLRGRGSGAFQVEWLRERPFRESARDAHSLYVETAAELGLAGLLALAALLAGAVLAARRAAAPAATAAAAVFAVHAGVDWDWELPAVTLAALAAVLRLAAECEAPPGSSSRAPATRPAAS